MREATIEDLKRGIKLMKDVKFSESCINFPCLGDPRDWSIVVYTDASYANLDGTHSTFGLIVFLVGDGQSAPISWRSGKIDRVVRSTLAAETLALEKGLEEAYFVKSRLLEFLSESELPILAVVDNKSLIEAVHSTSSVDDRGLRIDIACIKQAMTSKDRIRSVKRISWCPGREQLANALTKRGASGSMLREVLKRGRLDLMV
jgi:hypothetical protein